MKTKKMFLLFAAFIFAAVAGYNIHLAQTQNSGDISLADITVMAQAEGESGGGSYTCWNNLELNSKGHVRRQCSPCTIVMAWITEDTTVSTCSD